MFKCTAMYLLHESSTMLCSRWVEGANGLRGDGMQKSLTTLNSLTRMQRMSYDFLPFLHDYLYTDAALMPVDKIRYTCLKRCWFSTVHFETKQCSFSSGFSGNEFSTRVLDLDLVYHWRLTCSYVASFTFTLFILMSLHVGLCCVNALCQCASDPANTSLWLTQAQRMLS